MGTARKILSFKRLNVAKWRFGDLSVSRVANRVIEFPVTISQYIAKSDKWATFFITAYLSIFHLCGGANMAHRKSNLEPLGPKRRGNVTERIRRADRKFIKRAKRNQYKLGYRAPLLKRDDFLDEESYRDDYLGTEIPKPYIQFSLYRGPRPDKNRVKRIDIVYTFWEQDPKPAMRPLHSLLGSAFEAGYPGNPHSKRSPGFPYAFVLGGVGKRTNEAMRGDVPAVFGHNTLFTFCDNLWNDYCLFVGNTSTPRLEFCAWVYRFTALAADLLDYPLALDPLPGKRRKVVRAIVRERYGEVYDCYNRDRWRSLLREPKFDKWSAQFTRLLDARETYDRFLREIKPVSPLEIFLHDLAGSLYGELCSLRLLVKCPVCGHYFLHREGKKFCSLFFEGTNCGKKARDRKYYAKYRRKNTNK